MSLKDQITSDMRDAMRAHDKEKLSAPVSYTHLTLPTKLEV